MPHTTHEVIYINIADLFTEILACWYIHHPLCSCY
jgi:hypothetical protein